MSNRPPRDFGRYHKHFGIFSETYNLQAMNLDLMRERGVNKRRLIAQADREMFLLDIAYDVTGFQF